MFKHVRLKVMINHVLERKDKHLCNHLSACLYLYSKKMGRGM